MNKIFTCSLIATVPGFIFGFDTILISGADRQLRDLWQSSAIVHTSLVMSTALWGIVVGALFGSLLLNSIGRKRTLTWIGVLFVLSALGSLLSKDPYTFSLFRFIGGLGIGASTLATPSYISEIAPARIRGRNTGLYQLNIVIGILAAFLVSAVLENSAPETWRWMLGMQTLMALSFTAATLLLPESPKWLFVMQRDAEAQQALESLRSSELSEEANSEQLERMGSYETIFMKKYKYRVLLAFFIAFFNQLSGINVLLYYAGDLFESAGVGENATFLKVAIGIVNLIFTVIGLFLIDKVGRRPLLLLGSVGYITSFGCAAVAFYSGWGNAVLYICLAVFMASHAIGQGLVIWVFIAELFPVNVRASGLALGSSVHWILAAVIPSALPLIVNGVSPQTVLLSFIGIMAFQLIFVIFAVPETKGRTFYRAKTNHNNKHFQNDKYKKTATPGTELYLPSAGSTTGATATKR
ncbi:sugar porter family MFS transporter [Flavobacterium sp. Sd200]|uniref:sugar porter family MFS transporter n=1 Tax=Flavobacterium sp. Sd200 TaxID=2692211 RepID=UPI00136ADDDB|nr:sugar porter family MFS transporter [Flavobacterium sp. Sd200]